MGLSLVRYTDIHALQLENICSLKNVMTPNRALVFVSRHQVLKNGGRTRINVFLSNGASNQHRHHAVRISSFKFGPDFRLFFGNELRENAKLMNMCISSVISSSIHISIHRAVYLFNVLMAPYRYMRIYILYINAIGDLHVRVEEKGISTEL